MTEEFFMGLFDRFKKRVKQPTTEEEITVDENSEEAALAIAEREKNLLKINSDIQKNEENEDIFEIKEEWDNLENETLQNPFLSSKSSKERKKLQRDKKIKQTLTSNTKKKIKDPMLTTTGRKLIKLNRPIFNIDISQEQVQRGGRVIKGGPVLDEILEELEEDLLSADIGHTSVLELINLLRIQLIGIRINKKIGLEEIIERIVKNALLSLLEVGYWDFDKTIQNFLSKETPVIIMMVGVNGTGKTTTTAKITHRLTNLGYSVVLAAADTFRAGAIDQLSLHAEKLGVRCIQSQRGGDAAAVSRDAIESAKAKGEDIVIIDTAGRMQNKTNLMNELQKIHRVTEPHLVLFVADALAGNDAVMQAKEFQKILTFDGAVLSKLDTDARGGAALSIAHATGRPIVLAGIGQEYQDLELFNPKWLLDSILN
jgi:fused signal recognition particle receptor|tara:strand:+ start:7952 stop:9235 length:1284 start_codon:yes stop_codon:yes gene_type:complete